MKKLLLILFLLFIINVNAQEFPKYQDKYVNDFANIFSQDEIQDLRNILNEIEKNTTAEIVIFTIETTNPLTPQEYRTKLFNEWNIGKKDKDNGLLILYSLKENRIEVETGYGLEGILPDSKLGRLLDENYVPYRDKKQLNQGIILFTKEIAKIINENQTEVSNLNDKWNFKMLNLIVSLLPFIFFIIFILIIISMFKKRNLKCDKDGLPMKYLGLIAGYYTYKCAKGHIHKKERENRIYFGGFGMGGFGGSGGFGGGGFGGGSSGGGGAGR